jgi:hypothetical protein
MFRFVLDTEESRNPQGLSVDDINTVHGEAQPAQNGNAQCSICLENIDEGVRCNTLQCEHTFHTQCITQWFATHTTCPVCRRENGTGNQRRQSETEQIDGSDVFHIPYVVHTSYVILEFRYPDESATRSMWHANDTLVHVFEYVSRSFTAQTQITLNIHNRYFKNTESLLSLDRPLCACGISGNTTIDIFVG